VTYLLLRKKGGIYKIYRNIGLTPLTAGVLENVKTRINLPETVLIGDSDD
jgi:hypothetical protein